LCASSDFEKTLVSEGRRYKNTSKYAKAWVADNPRRKGKKLVYQLMIDGKLTYDINSANIEIEKANDRGQVADLAIIGLWFLALWRF
jgi:hypothetical protein